jgi:maleylacetoacetate isomerase
MNSAATTPTHQLTLYHYWRSSCSWRVRWALHHKGVIFSDLAVNLLQNEQNSPTYLAKNPGGYVPALEINGQIFGESMAILEWIEETWPHNPLLPASALDRLRVRQICNLIVSGIQPVQNLGVMRKHSSDAGQQAAWAHHWINLGLAKLEALIAPIAGTYCLGGELTMADLCLVPQVYNAQRFNVDLGPYPTIARINQHCLSLKSCIAAAPQNQKGATP